MFMTEFGRPVRRNGSPGTDHGRGSCLFILATPADDGALFPGWKGERLRLLTG